MDELSPNVSDSSERPDQKLPRTRVLRLKSDFERLRGQGAKQVSRHLVCNYLRVTGARRMTAFIVPRRCGNAVTRNQIKRWLRESYRKLQHSLPHDLHLVWIARHTCASADYHTLSKDLEQLVTKVNRKLKFPEGAQEGLE